MVTPAPPLKVYFEDLLVGELFYDINQNNFHFTYDSGWVEQKQFPFSPHVPLTAPPAPGAVSRFLENLLPEGRGLKDLAQNLKVPLTNTYALIAAIGKETTGAFSFIAGKERPDTRFRPIPKEELTQRIKERKARSLMIWDGRPRLSLAGVQEKLAVVIKNKEYGLGEGNISSTHILKFGNEKVPHLVLNEYYCMQLANAVGIPVAQTQLVEFSERVLQVERFDRAWISEARVARHHIIDGCQALDISPDHKYERLFGDGPETADILGPASLINLYKFCQQCLVPAKAQLQLLQWVIFNLLIGNSDHHVKNISYYIDQEGISMAPAYDLLNVTVYPKFDQSLAFQIGDTFKLEEMNAYQFAEMANELGLAANFLAAQIKKISEKTLKSLDKIAISGLNAEENQFIGILKENIKTRTHQFLSESSKIKLYKLGH